MEEKETEGKSMPKTQYKIGQKVRKTVADLVEDLMEMNIDIINKSYLRAPGSFGLSFKATFKSADNDEIEAMVKLEFVPEKVSESLSRKVSETAEMLPGMQEALEPTDGARGTEHKKKKGKGEKKDPMLEPPQPPAPPRKCGRSEEEACDTTFCFENSGECIPGCDKPKPGTGEEVPLSALEGGGQEGPSEEDGGVAEGPTEEGAGTGPEPAEIEGLDTSGAGPETQEGAGPEELNLGDQAPEKEKEEPKGDGQSALPSTDTFFNEYGVLQGPGLEVLRLELPKGIRADIVFGKSPLGGWIGSKQVDIHLGEYVSGIGGLPGKNTPPKETRELCIINLLETVKEIFTMAGPRLTGKHVATMEKAIAKVEDVITEVQNMAIFNMGEGEDLPPLEDM